jgi:hypothetical protein
MHRLLRHHHRLALDEGTAERLLTGRLDPSDAPPGYARAAAVLAAASAPPDTEELAGEAAVRAVFAAAVRSHPAGVRLLTPRRSRALAKLLTVKAAAAVLGLLVTGGVAAATTGNLPAPAQHAAHALLGGAGVPAPAQATTTTSTEAVRPDAAGPAALGLCRAWAAGQVGQQHGGKLDAPTFAALAKAAGGSDQIGAYCAEVTASTASGSRQGQGGRPSSVPPTTAGGAGQERRGPPSSLPATTASGSGQGQGSPPGSLPATTAAGPGQAGTPSSVPPSTMRP